MTPRYKWQRRDLGTRDRAVYRLYHDPSGPPSVVFVGHPSGDRETTATIEVAGNRSGWTWRMFCAGPMYYQPFEYRSSTYRTLAEAKAAAEIAVDRGFAYCSALENQWMVRL